MTALLVSSWLTGLVRRHFPAGAAPDPVSFREVLEGRLTDARKPRGKRHPLPSLVSVLVAGVAGACTGPLAVAQAARGWSQEVLAAHGCRVSLRTGLGGCTSIWAPNAQELPGAPTRCEWTSVPVLAPDASSMQGSPWPRLA